MRRFRLWAPRPQRPSVSVASDARSVPEPQCLAPSAPLAVAVAVSRILGRFRTAQSAPVPSYTRSMPHEQEGAYLLALLRHQWGDEPGWTLRPNKEYGFYLLY